MAERETTNLPEETRREVFRTLVDVQDKGAGVEQSRKMVAKQFSLTEVQVREIEREGLQGEWPPL